MEALGEDGNKAQIVHDMIDLSFFAYYTGERNMLAESRDDDEVDVTG